MKKIIFILLTVFTLPLFAQETVIFIPGWFTEWINYSRHRKLLSELFPGAELQVHKWDSNRLWKNAKSSAAQAVTDLTNKLVPAKAPEKTTLIGHSLGGRIILDSMTVLAAKKIKVKQIILLGSAVKPDDETLALLQKISAEPVINICCPQDNILKLYCQEEKEIPLGFAGIPHPLKNFRQFRMEIPEKSVKIGKFTVIPAEALATPRQTAAHLAIYYLKTLHQAFNGEVPEYYLDYAALKKIAAKNSREVKKRSGFREIEEVDGWQFARHSKKNFWRITTPAGKSFYYSDETSAFANFREIKRRLSSILQK